MFQMEAASFRCTFRTVLPAVLSITLTISLAMTNDQAGNSQAMRGSPYMVRQAPRKLFYRTSDPNQGDRPVVLECEAHGDPAPEYKWTKNRDPFPVSSSDARVHQEPGTGTLTIRRPKDVDEGLYQCSAKNSHGTSLADAVYLRHGRLDTFQTGDEQEEISVEEGKPLTIKCHPPTGIPRPHVFWVVQGPGGAPLTINSSRIAVDPEGDLHFSNVTLQDASGNNTYACAAYSPFLNEYKFGSLKKLIVQPSGSVVPNKVSPVRQYTSPKNMTGIWFRPIDISCIYGGTPLPQIRWERENAPLPPRRHLVTDFGRVLRIKDLKFEDTGTYKCITSNGIGQVASHAVNLTIEAEPYWITQPHSVAKVEGEDHQFSCIAGGFPTPRVQWLVNGVPIENTLPKANRVVHGKKITLTNLQKDVDTANYQCNASNAHGYIFADVFINVRDLPESGYPPASITEALEGSEVMLGCQVSGPPYPRVLWEKDGRTINGSRYEILQHGNLVIHGTTTADNGDYTCRAQGRPEKIRASNQLEIKSKTTIKTPPVDTARALGESATFHCSANSDPRLHVQIVWAHDDVPLSPGESGRVLQSKANNSLTISPVQQDDSGVYKCIAQTRLDQAEASASLLVHAATS